jgi:hypothetical protein
MSGYAKHDEHRLTYTRIAPAMTGVVVANTRTAPISAGLQPRN